MSAKNTMTSVLVPLQQRPLLLPAACVVEVLDYSRPEKTTRETDWLLGNTLWRGQEIPVISFEKLNRRQFAEFSATNRIMIVRRTTEECDIPYYGMIVQGLPQSQSLVPEDMTVSQEETGPAEKIQVLFREVPAILPDLAYVEEQLTVVNTLA